MLLLPEFFHPHTTCIRFFLYDASSGVGGGIGIWRLLLPIVATVLAGKRLLIAIAAAGAATAAVIGSGGRRVATGILPIIAMVIIDDGDDGV